MSKTTLRVHLWLENEQGMLFGIGRALLLKKVSQLGSLNKAAKELGMSYRAAWGKIKATENALGQPVLSRSQGKRGFKLTAVGQKLLEQFDLCQNEVEIFAMQKAKEKFSWPIEKYQE